MKRKPSPSLTPLALPTPSANEKPIPAVRGSGAAPRSPVRRSATCRCRTTRRYCGAAVHLLDAVWFYRILTVHGMTMLIFFILYFEMAILYFTAGPLLKSRIAAPKLGWAAFAIMTVGAVHTEWMTRTRVAGFRVYDNGPPDAAAWLTLIGEPIGMLAILFVVWGRQVRDGLGGLARSHAGRLLMVGTTLARVLGLGAVALRVRGASEPVMIVLTLDPWRDTPARLPALASAWGLGPDAYLLSGEVVEVEAALDA